MSNKEEEIWKVYPKFPFIEASNLGRVRTVDRYVPLKNGGKRFIKGRVLKQFPNNKGYMCISFGSRGRQIHLLVHRIISTCFLPNPNNYPQVNHKDNNPKNNAVSNLEWCTSQYNVAYRERYGTSAAETVGRPVFAVELKTGKVLKFETQHEAARQLGVHVESINRIVKGKLNQTGGYWFTEDESEITEERIREIKAKMVLLDGVIAIDLDSLKALWFESQSETSRQLGVSVGYINNVIKGLYNKAKGFWFCYADENAVEKTRKEFGDELARKVEELIRQNQN